MSEKKQKPQINEDEVNEEIIEETITEDEWTAIMEAQLKVAMTPIPAEELEELQRRFGHLPPELLLKRFDT